MIQRTERLGMISVPWQQYTTPMKTTEALRCGTIFCELSQPYTPISCNPSSTQSGLTMPGMQGMTKKR